MNIFEGISLIIMASITYVWYIRQESVKTKEKSELIIEEKNKIIEDAFVSTSISLVTRMYKEVFDSVILEMSDQTQSIREFTNIVSDKYDEEMLRLHDDVKLSDTEINKFVEASYVSIYLTDFPSEFSEIIKTASQAIIYGFALTICIYIFGIIWELPLNHIVYRYIPKMELNITWGYVILLLCILYYKKGIQNITKLYKLQDILDKVKKAKNIDRLYDVL